LRLTSNHKLRTPFIKKRNFLLSRARLKMAAQVRMKVTPVPVLTDNYAYLVYDEHTKIAAAVDPAEPEKVIKAAKNEGVTITTILTTHHHGDHAGGNSGMCAAIPGLVVVGGKTSISPHYPAS